ncbi:MAG: leucine--tRNA ligase [Patescibacteria group bacterium]
MSYDHKNIDGKWQKRWMDAGVFEAKNDSPKEKCYLLVEFPYPSGAGLHVGHPRSYTAIDIIARKRRMEGKNVLFPMGWDAFGLPAENYAIKTGNHPGTFTQTNIDTFRRQLQSMGFSFDWSREVNTTDPAYYKWTQWMFLEFFKAGLAYKAEMAINWCPKDLCGLANEEVIAGKCERCGTPVEKKMKSQWMIAITKYADRLLADLDTVNYLPKIKKQQEEWIGRKEGMIFHHKVKDLDAVLDSFTAYPIWSYADTFLVIAPEHPVVADLVAGTEYESAVNAFIEETKAISDDARTEDSFEKKGVFTGRVAIDPLTGREMPVWIANFALMNFGTGIIRCSAHDERDVEFATKYQIPMVEVVDRVNPDEPVSAHDNAGVLKDSGPFTGKSITPELIEESIAWFAAQGFGEKHVTYRLRDWVFSRQRYWGEPIPLVHCEVDGWVAVPVKELPVVLPNVENYQPTENGESPLANIESFVNTKCPQCGGAAKRETDTMPNWAGSSWYFLRYTDAHNDKEFASKEALKQWMPIDIYNGGMEHTTLHLLYSRFWNKFLFDKGFVPTSEPYARRHSHGLIMSEDGTKMSKSKGNVVNPDEIVDQHGADTLRVYEMFMGPFEEPVPWNTNGVIGVRRFLDKAIRMVEKVSENEDVAVTKSLHRTIAKIASDIEGFGFNTAVAQLMMFVNVVQEKGAITTESLKTFLRVLVPFAPHVANEMWEKLGGVGFVEEQEWPVADALMLKDDTVEIAVQVNGKLRGTIVVASDEIEETIVKMARTDENVSKYVTGEPKKTIVVKGKLVNFVVEL